MLESDKKFSVSVVTIMDEIFTVARDVSKKEVQRKITSIEMCGITVKSRPTNLGDTLYFLPTSIYKIIVRNFSKDDKCA
jgi:hypothetical protein